MSLNALAAHAIKRHALDEPDEEMLLDALGLTGEDGTTPPDDTNVYTFSEPSSGPGARNPDAPTATTRPRAKPMTTPPGLANLPPAAPTKGRGPKAQPKVIRPRKQREVPECGSYKAYARHKRRDEPVDDACLEAGREYHRTYSAGRQTRLRKEKELKRLADAGVNETTAQVLSELAR